MLGQPPQQVRNTTAPAPHLKTKCIQLLILTLIQASSDSHAVRSVGSPRNDFISRTLKQKKCSPFQLLGGPHLRVLPGLTGARQACIMTS